MSTQRSPKALAHVAVLVAAFAALGCSDDITSADPHWNSMSITPSPSVAVASSAPDAPSLVDVVVAADMGLWITWTDNSLNETGFRIDKSFDDGSGWNTYWTTPADVNRASYWPATPEERICFRIIAVNSIAVSSASNVVCTTPPAAATELQTAMVDGIPQLTWKDNSSVEDGYYILRSTAWSGGYIDDDMELIATVGPNVTTFRDSVPVTTPCLEQVFYHVQPMKGNGAGQWSNMAVAEYCGAGTVWGDP